MNIHSEIAEELKYFAYPPKDVRDLLIKLIKIELKMQIYEEKIRLNLKDDILGRDIISLCRSALLDTLIWARIVLPSTKFKDYKEREDKIINEVDKGKTASPDRAYQLYLMTAQNIIDAFRFAKTKVYPFIMREIVDNLDASLVRLEKEEEKLFGLRRK